MKRICIPILMLLNVFFMKQVFDVIACEAVESPSCGWFNIRTCIHLNAQVKKIWQNRVGGLKKCVAFTMLNLY